MLERIKSFRTNLDGKVSFSDAVNEAAAEAQETIERTEINALE